MVETPCRDPLPARPPPGRHTVIHPVRPIPPLPTRPRGISLRCLVTVTPHKISARYLVTVTIALRNILTASRHGISSTLRLTASPHGNTSWNPLMASPDLAARRHVPQLDFGRVGAYGQHVTPGLIPPGQRRDDVGLCAVRLRKLQQLLRRPRRSVPQEDAVPQRHLESNSGRVTSSGYALTNTVLSSCSNRNLMRVVPRGCWTATSPGGLGNNHPPGRARPGSCPATSE